MKHELFSRNARVFVPSTYCPGTKLPVIISLHRFNGAGNGMESYINGIPGLPSNPVPVTGARESVQRWADWNGCSALLDEPAPSLDLDSGLVGPDTVVATTTDCANGVTAD